MVHLWPLRYLTALRYECLRSYYTFSVRYYAGTLNSNHRNDTVNIHSSSKADHSNHAPAEGESENHLQVTTSEQYGEQSKEERMPQKMKLGPWRPLKRLTRSEMNHLRSLRQLQPEEWTTGRLSKMFGVSSSAVKRILRSKFDPSQEVEERQEKRAQEQRLKRREKLLSDIRSKKVETVKS